MALLKRFERKSFRRKQKPVSLWKRIFVGVLIFLTIGLLLYGVWYVAHRPGLLISDVTVSGGETISHDDVRTRAEELLRGDYFLIVPKRFTYLYPEDTIHERVSDIPRIKNVQLERPSRTELHIAVDEYVPNALWCTSLDASSTDPCLFVDTEGTAFVEAPRLLGGTFTRYVTEDVAPEVGKQVHSDQILLKTGEFAGALLSGHQMRVYAVTLTKDGDFRYHVAGGGEVLVTPTMSIQETFDNLDSILASEEFMHLAPGNFEYIDLRFGSKIFVKEVSDEPEEIFEESEPAEEVTTEE